VSVLIKIIFGSKINLKDLIIIQRVKLKMGKNNKNKKAKTAQAANSNDPEVIKVINIALHLTLI